MIAKKNILRIFVLGFFFLSLQGVVLSQRIIANNEIGKPFIQHYGPSDYKSAPQNFAILQDHRGIIYVGNNQGEILEYDGVTWRHILFPNRLPVRALAEDNEGQIYVGGSKDFGYLAPDSTGTLQFQSLLKYVKEEDNIFQKINSVYATRFGIFFCSQERLFCWKNNKIKVWSPQTIFGYSFLVNGNLYIYQEKVGLMIMKNDSITLSPGGEKFSDKPILAMFPYTTNSVSREKSNNIINKAVLLGIKGEGLFSFDGNSLMQLRGAVNEFILRNGITCGVVLNDSCFSIGSFKKGAIIFNTRGEILQTLDKDSGLSDEAVFSIEPGYAGGIWMALLQGFAFVNRIQPAFSLFDENKGLVGVIHPSPAPIRHNGILYVSTVTGVYYLDQKEGRFFSVPGTVGETWSFFKYNNSLFIAGLSVRKINGANSELVKTLHSRVVITLRSDFFPNRVYLGYMDGGLEILELQNNEWIISRKIKNIKEMISGFVEEPNGDLWLGTHSDIIIRVRFSIDKENPEIQRFGTESGLPVGRKSVFKFSKFNVFPSESGIFRFNELTGKFFPDTTFESYLLNGSKGIGVFTEDKKGNIWIIVSEKSDFYLNVLRHNPNGTYSYERTNFRGIPSTGIWTIYPEDDGIIWYGGENGLIRYDDNLPKIKHDDFPVFIRRVMVNQDSIVYGGFQKQNNIELIYNNNALHFEYSASYYDHPDQNTYRVFLEGFDKDWSNWTSEASKDYTNLPPGNYVFNVRAKNIYEYESSEAAFAFKILPPFYLSWWAYFIYGTFFIGLLTFVIKGYNKRQVRLLTQRTNELERTVAERTVELEEKNSELQELSTMKSRFFANISHEFRTPLTLILGQIENLLPHLKKEGNIKRAQMALRNTRQLQQLINQLLDLSKFDAGEMKLKASKQNIIPLLRYLTGSFESYAEKKKINLKFESSQRNINVYYEQDKIEKVMHNLLSNAIKFTPEGGNIMVSIETDPLPDGLESSVNELSGDLKILVRDSGIGIAKNQLPHIFDRFFQVDNSASRNYEGTGIGLSLTKELVQIHGGGISVESKEGFGTTFTILLPLGKSHLKPDQVVKIQEPASDLIPQDLKIQTEPAENLEVSEAYLQVKGNESSKLILVVEDNPDMQAYIYDTLVNAYNVVEASNGVEGLQKAIDEVPDLIITDVMMPKMDGYELTRNLRKNQATSHIPIIMLTAKAAESDKFEGLETGVDVFLIKPFSTKELQIRVRKQIEIREMLQKQLGVKAILSPSKISVPSIDQQFLSRIHNIIEENIGNENFSVDKLAEQIALSKRQLQRKLKALTDSTPQQCIRTMRLGKAKQLIEQGAGNVTEVAFSVGYSDVTAFSRAFKEEFNRTPSSLINKL